MSSVFIIGAGASIDAGFPTGDQLRGTIARLLDFDFENRYNGRLLRGDNEIYHALQIMIQRNGRHANEINHLISAARQVAQAIRIAPSIDHLIEAHRGNEDLSSVSKLAIGKAIKDCEALSKIVVDPGNIYNRMDFDFVDQQTWYRELFNILFLGCAADDVETVLASVTFIVFNYDRSLEYVLFHLIKDFFGIDAEKAQDLILDAIFYHPYGTVGSRGRTSPAEKHLMDFSSKAVGPSLIQIAESLKTFSEGTDESISDIAEIHESLLNADQIVSLGFAYHEINLRLLAVDGDRGTIPFYGTAMGISPSNLTTVRQDLADHLDLISIKALEDVTCKKFLSDYSGVIGRIHRDSL